MKTHLGHTLSRRERQILDILFERGEASAADVHTSLPDAPSYSAVRALLRILEDKGHVRHSVEGQRYIFRPVIARQTAAKSALDQVLQTFFGGSVEKVVATLLTTKDTELSDEQLDRLSKMIEEAKESSR